VPVQACNGTALPAIREKVARKNSGRDKVKERIINKIGKITFKVEGVNNIVFH